MYTFKETNTVIWNMEWLLCDLNEQIQQKEKNCFFVYFYKCCPRDLCLWILSHLFTSNWLCRTDDPCSMLLPSYSPRQMILFFFLLFLLQNRTKTAWITSFWRHLFFLEVFSEFVGRTDSSRIPPCETSHNVWPPVADQSTSVYPTLTWQTNPLGVCVCIRAPITNSTIFYSNSFHSGTVPLATCPHH